MIGPRVVATGAHVATPDGKCIWRWHWEDSDLRCDEHAVPGALLCADHLIEKARRSA